MQVKKENRTLTHRLQSCARTHWDSYRSHACNWGDSYKFPTISRSQRAHSTAYCCAVDFRKYFSYYRFIKAEHPVFSAVCRAPTKEHTKLSPFSGAQILACHFMWIFEQLKLSVRDQAFAKETGSIRKLFLMRDFDLNTGFYSSLPSIWPINLLMLQVFL